MLSSSVDSYRNFGRDERRSHVSLFCCAISSMRTLPWNTPEFSSSSSSIVRLQPLHRESLRPPGDTLLPPPADVSLFPTAKYTNVVDRCNLFPGSNHPSSLPACGGTSTAPIPSTLVDSKPEVDDSVFPSHISWTLRCLRLGRLSGCTRHCRRDHLHLLKSETRPGTYRSAEPDDLLVQRENRHRHYCLVLLFSSSSTQDVGSRSVSIPSAPLTWGLEVNVPVHYSGMTTLLRCDHGTCRWLVLGLEPYCTRMFPGRYRHGCVRLSTLVDRTL